jgi:PQQ-dependent catabolism-associated CXXCW motif protein
VRRFPLMRRLAKKDWIAASPRGRVRGPAGTRPTSNHIGGNLVRGLGLMALLLVPVPLAAATVPEPPGYRMDDFRSPVPATLRGAKVLTSDEAADLWNKNAATFIDVYPQAPKPANLPAGTFWRDPVHRSIEGAHWVPNVGYGALSPAMDAYFRQALARLTGSKRDAAVVFFCLKDCWMSWNAAKRALELGYTNVMWFSEGTDGWQELGYPLIDVKKDP